MLPDAYRELFETLVKKTQKNEVNWTRSPRAETFVVSFAEFGLSIYYGYDENDREQFVLIKLINDQGRDADSFWIAESEPDFAAAAQLFQAAKRKADRIDITIAKVLSELRKQGPVGEPPKPDPDDELPF